MPENEFFIKKLSQMNSERSKSFSEEVVKKLLYTYWEAVIFMLQQHEVNI